MRLQIKYTFDIRRTSTGLLVRSEMFDTAEEAFNACAAYCKDQANVSMGWTNYNSKEFYGETGVAYE